eukprot:Sspe_Gene.87836::Locus_59742_Transcript_1_1_Confidence_1.000_Length_2126::g.87836::m.87836
MVLLVPVVLVGSQALGHPSVEGVELHDDQHVEPTGDKGQQTKVLGLVWVEDGPGCGVLSDRGEVEGLLPLDLPVDVPLEVQGEHHDYEGNAQQAPRHYGGKPVGHELPPPGVVPLLPARHTGPPQLTLELRADLGFALKPVVSPLPGQLACFTVPAAQENHRPEDDKERVEGEVRMVVDAVVAQLDVEPEEEADCGREEEPRGEEVHPGKVEGNVGSKVVVDGAGGGQGTPLGPLPQGSNTGFLVEWCGHLEHSCNAHGRDDARGDLQRSSSDFGGKALKVRRQPLNPSNSLQHRPRELRFLTRCEESRLSVVLEVHCRCPREFHDVS